MDGAKVKLQVSVCYVCLSAHKVPCISFIIEASASHSSDDCHALQIYPLVVLIIRFNGQHSLVYWICYSVRCIDHVFTVSKALLLLVAVCSVVMTSLGIRVMQLTCHVLQDGFSYLVLIVP